VFSKNASKLIDKSIKQLEKHCCINGEIYKVIFTSDDTELLKKGEGWCEHPEVS
jgi:hypothetical protein